MIDVLEAATRMGRTVNAVRHLIKKGRLRKVPSGDRRVLVYASEVDALARIHPAVQLRLLAGSGA